MDLPNLWLWLGLRIGPQLMDGLSAGRSPPQSKEEEEDGPCTGLEGHIFGHGIGLSCLGLSSGLGNEAM